MLGALFFLATKMEGFFQALEMEYLKYLAWPLYWFCAGAVGTGVWILAHGIFFTKTRTCSFNDSNFMYMCA